MRETTAAVSASASNKRCCPCFMIFIGQVTRRYILLAPDPRVLDTRTLPVVRYRLVNTISSRAWLRREEYTARLQQPYDRRSPGVFVLRLPTVLRLTWALN